MATDEPLADEEPEADDLRSDDVPDRPGRRRSRLRAAAAVLVLALVAVGGAFGWHWRTHPEAFFEVGNKIKITGGQLGQPHFVTMSASEQKGTVRIERLSPNFRRNTSKAAVEFFVCTVDPASGAGTVGFVRRRSFERSCPDPVPARAGVELELDAQPRQEIVMSITPQQRGVAVIDGAKLTYSRGWQHGTQSIGIHVRVALRDR